MKKFLLTLFFALTCFCFAFGLSSCKDDNTDGTYYLFVSGEIQEDAYVKLEGETWTYADDESGTFILKGNTIIFFGEAFGLNVQLFEGTIKDGVLTLYVSGPDEDPDVYYKEGKSPKDNEETNSPTQKQTCTVSFDSQGGTEVESQEIEIGKKATKPTDPTKPGYTFQGWYLEEEKWSFIGYVITEDTTLKAAWLVNTYTLTFDSQGGNPITESKQVVYDKTYGALPTTEKEGATFAGWYTKAEGGKRITSTSTVKITQSTSLYAHWYTHYTVSFDSQGGNTIEDKIIPYTYPYGTLETPTQAGCVFVGWYTEPNGGEEITATSKMYVSKNSTLYAHWQTDAIYTLRENGTEQYYEVTGLHNHDVNELVILSTYNQLPVKSIKSYALGYAPNLTSVVVPDSVTSIGEDSFSGCSSLTEITLPFVGNTKDETGNTDFGCIFGSIANKYHIPSSLKTVIITGGTSIRHWAFEDCSGLTSITIPNSVTSIEDYAFYGCSNLIQVENGVSYVDKWVIDCDTSVSSVSLRTDTKGIADSAFRDCSSLTSITIPDSVTSIGRGSFLWCSLLNDIYITDIDAWLNIHFNDTSLLKFNSKLYLNGTAMTTILTGNFIIPEGVTSIPAYTFSGCNDLTSITIPDSVTEIEEGAFSGCNSLTSITIPDSVTSIGEGAFYNCGNLIQIENGVYYVDKWVIDCNYSLSSVSLRTDTKGIANSAFYNCTSLTSITIPDSVTSIGDYAFRDCSSLTSITIPDSVTSIESSAFRDCHSLTSITIPDSVTSIESSAFCHCSSLTSITIPDSVTSIQAETFYGCISLTSITIPNSVTSIGGLAFQNCRSLTSITLPDSITFIEDFAFNDCCKLVEVVNKSSISISTGNSNNGYVGYYAKQIITDEADSKLRRQGDYLFYEDGVNSALIGYYGTDATLVLPNKINGNNYAINQYAFQSCSNLTSISIPDSVTSIGSYTFRWCGNLTSITIPDSVTSIGDFAFSVCDKLITVYYEGTANDWNKISIATNYNSNSYLTSATRYYYSEEAPTDEGNYWRYVDGAPTVWA